MAKTQARPAPADKTPHGGSCPPDEVERIPPDGGGAARADAWRVRRLTLTPIVPDLDKGEGDNLETAAIVPAAGGVAFGRLVVADTHAIVREGICMLLERRGFAIAGEAATGAQAIAHAVALRPDLVLLELDLPDFSGPEVCSAILSRAPGTAVAVLTREARTHDVRACVDAGVSGFLLKDEGAGALTRAIRAILEGGSVLHPRAAQLLRALEPPSPAGRNLTARERRVLELVAAGMTNSQIGAHLHLSRHTVKEYLSNAMRKLDVNSRLQAVIVADQHGLIRVPGSHSPVVNAGSRPALTRRLSQDAMPVRPS